MKTNSVFFIFLLVLGFYLLAFNHSGEVDGLFADSKEVKVDKNTMVENGFVKLLKEENLAIDKDVYILNFWASWCSPCMNELPGLSRLSHLYKSKGVEVITVNIDYENQEKIIKKIKKDLSLDMKIIQDKNGKYVERFNIEGLPITMFFQKTSLNDLVAGEIDFDSTETHEKIDQLLKLSEKN